MILKEYINEKLELAFQELGQLSREELPAETWEDLCHDRAGLKLGSLEKKLTNLFADAVRKPERNDLAANTFLIAYQYIQCCLTEARTVALVHCCHAKIVETAKEDMGDTIPLMNLIQVIMFPAVKNAKSRLARLKIFKVRWDTPEPTQRLRRGYKTSVFCGQLQGT